MVKYKRVSYEVRCQIEAYLKTPISMTELSQVLGLHKSTIYREISRNQSGKDYCAIKAEKVSRNNFKKCRRKSVIDFELKESIQDKLIYGWSPEQIAGRLEKEGIRKINYKTIYNFIKKEAVFRSFLRRDAKRGAGRFRQRKALINLNKLNIEDRPQVVNERKRVGDWERDLFYVGNKKLVLICADRKSRFIKLSKIKSGTGAVVQKETIKLLNETGKIAYTITNDNGPEFKGNLPIGIPIYFCKPQRPNQRGTIENSIGLIRQYITRKTDIEDYSEKKIKEIESFFNLRPRKCLDYKTPYEVYYDKRVALVVTN